MQSRAIVAALFVLLVAAGCSADSEVDPGIELDDITDEHASGGSPNERPSEEPATTAPREPTPTDADEGPVPDDEPPDPPIDDPFAVPEIIDEAYVDLVLDELLRIRTEFELSLHDRPLQSSVLASDRTTAEAIFAGPELTTRLTAVQDFLNTEEARERAIRAEDAGRYRFEVVELGPTSEVCVAAFGWPDITEVSQRPFSQDTFAVFVLARNASVDRDLNPTGWQFWDNTLLVTPEGDPIPHEAWSDLDYNGILDMYCGSDPE